jgi:inhibitor of cysteine peptidase
MLSIDASYLGRTVDLVVGEIMELRLEENPTTGFRWSMVGDGAPACTVETSAFEARSAVPGQGGERAWRFRAALAGSCDIRLLYRRGWESDAKSARTFEVHVQVRE